MRDNALSQIARRQIGLSLIELMVALVAAIIFSLAVLLTQIALTKQNVVMSDVSQRDNQSRAALDLVTQDLSNAAYVINGVGIASCNITLAYNSNGGAPTSQSPIMAFPQPQALPTSGAPTYDPSTFIPKPGPSQANVSDLISITQDVTALQPPGNGTTPSVYVVNNSVTKGTQTALSGTYLPLQSTVGLNPGDSGLLKILNFRNTGKNVCFRIPISNIGPSPNQINSQNNSTLSPPINTPFQTKGYGGFNGTLQNAKYLPSGQTLKNSDFINARLTDIGPAANGNMQTIAYYIARQNNAGVGNFPVLVRAVIDAQSGALLSDSPVAAGVVSLQALFGVDENNAGAVTNYLNWQDVVNGNFTNNVRSVLFAIVTKTLQKDPNTQYHAPGTIAIASPSIGPDSFVNYNVPTTYAKNHFSVFESEVAIRNQLWSH